MSCDVIRLSEYYAANGPVIPPTNINVHPRCHSLYIRIRISRTDISECSTATGSGVAWSKGRRRRAVADLHRGVGKQEASDASESVDVWVNVCRVDRGREARGKADTMLASPASRLSLIHRHWAIVRLPMPERKTPRTKNSIQLLNYFSPLRSSSRHALCRATPTRPISSCPCRLCQY